VVDGELAGWPNTRIFSEHVCGTIMTRLSRPRTQRARIHSEDDPWRMAQHFARLLSEHTQTTAFQLPTTSFLALLQPHFITFTTRSTFFTQPDAENTNEEKTNERTVTVFHVEAKCWKPVMLSHREADRDICETEPVLHATKGG
jgi:hypothetical protein